MDDLAEDWAELGHITFKLTPLAERAPELQHWPKDTVFLGLMCEDTNAESFSLREIAGLRRLPVTLKDNGDSLEVTGQFETLTFRVTVSAVGVFDDPTDGKLLYAMPLNQGVISVSPGDALRLNLNIGLR